MEGMKIFESKEVGADWREKKAEAALHAEALIQEKIPMLDTLEVSEQIGALKNLEEELTVDNENRFIAREVARKWHVLEEFKRHESELARYGVTV